MTTKLLKLEYQPTLKSTKVTGIQSRHLKYFILYSSIKLILACDNNLSGSKPFRSSKTAANYSNSQSNPTFRQIIQYDQTANRSNFEEIQMRSFQVHHKNFYMMSTFNQYCMNAFGWKKSKTNLKSSNAGQNQRLRPRNSGLRMPILR